MTTTVLPPAALVLGAFLMSALGTACALAWARRHRLLDLPGRRRLHASPTPRGGGLAAALVLLAAVILVALSIGVPGSGLVALALVAVTAVGALDDWRGVGVLPRVVVHLLAAVLVVLAWAPSVGTGAATPAVAVIAVIAVAWSINLHNFMDGADGMLGLQLLAVQLLYAVLAAAHGDGTLALLAAIGFAATAGFLPFNYPRARVFCGDAGSGALGLWIAALSLLGMRSGALDLGAVLIANSAFLVDATATLISRMVRGRRWYRAHREHLYQWLVRGGWSHARTAAAWLGWNVVVAAPALALRELAANGTGHSVLYSAGLPAAVLLSGTAVWWLGKRRVLRRVRQAV